MDNRERIAKLALEAQQGSQDAFNELYRLTRDRAYFVALTVTHNEQDALDIVQDSYLKAWQRMDSLEKPEQFPAWLRQITGNAAKDHIKHHSPLLFLESDDDTDDLFDLQEEKGSEYIPDDAMDTSETRRLVMEIVDGLPEDQRLCVLMYYYDEMPLQEIATALEIPYSTVMSRLALARKKIRLGVEALEKKQGVKLYSATPIPLLIWLLRRTAAETTAKALPPVVLGGTAAGAAGGLLAVFTLPKIIAAIAAVAVIGGGTAAAVAIARQPKARPAAAITTGAAVISEAQTNSRDAFSFSYPSQAEPLTDASGSYGYSEPQRGSVPPSAPQLPARSESAASSAVANTMAAAQSTTPAARIESTTASFTAAATTAAAAPRTTIRYSYTAASKATNSTAMATSATITTTATGAATAAQTTAGAITAAPVAITLNGSDDVSIEFMSNVFPEGVKLEVNNGRGYTTRIVDWSAPMQPYIYYNIVVRQNGQQVHPNGAVTIRLPLPENFIDLEVQHGADLVPVNAKVVGNQLEFTTNEL